MFFSFFLSVLLNIISVICDFSILIFLSSFWSFFEEAYNVLKIQRDRYESEGDEHICEKQAGKIEPYTLSSCPPRPCNVIYIF